MNRFFIPVVIFSFFAGPGSAQQILNGKILEDKTNAAIPYVNISVGYQNGTASNEQGEFTLTLNPDERKSRLEISCIGYYSRRLSIDSLLELGQRDLEIHLQPFITVLQEVTVSGKKAGPMEIVQEAIRKIPANYTQQPFNMTFYSRVAVNDSARTKYLVETFVESYREGYKEGARNHSKILQKRITGENPLPLYDKKRKMEYFAYEIIPGFDVFLVDMVGSGSKYNYTIFNPEYFKRLEFRQKEISIFDVDTVFVVEYDQKNFRSEEEKGISGKLYISTRTLAILKHERRIGKNFYEVIYKQHNGTYFPYFIKTIYPDRKVGSTYQLRVVHEAFIKSIVTQNVLKIDGPVAAGKNWHLEDVPYNYSFWDSFHVPGK